MDDNCGKWVESMDVASSCGKQEVGVASGWNLWVWLKCIGVVSGCVARTIDVLIIITCPYSTCLALFCSSIPTSLFSLKMFFRSCLCYFRAI